MTLTAGAVSLTSVTYDTATITAAVATGGTSPYTYQWYRSTTSGFTPGGGNIIEGATTRTFVDSGLAHGTTYYYKMVSTDTGHSNDTVTSSALAVTTQSVSNVFSYAATNVATTAFTTLCTATPVSCGKLEITDSSTKLLEIATGAAGAEQVVCTVVVSGTVVVPLYVPAGTRLSIRAIDAAATTGYNVVSFLQ